MTNQFNAVYAHEQEYESGYNACLACTKAVQTIAKIESIVGATGTVSTVIQGFWNYFCINSLIGSGEQASAGTFNADVWTYTWYLTSASWQHGRPR